MAQRTEVGLVTWVVGLVARHPIGGSLGEHGVDVVVGGLRQDLVEVESRFFF